tara:strand:+ start:393 stop:1097 length:705 start_codon:yes stop_codon:yes gene_type:complete
MTDELDLETYLSISSKKIGIYLLNKKELKNIYFKEQNFENNNVFINFHILKEFLDDNIFKIEKLIGKFIKNITLILESENILTLNIGLKKKNYEKIITKKFLENSLIELKDLINENYQNYRIMHMHLITYLFDGVHSSEFKFDMNCKNLSIETQFIFVPKKFILETDKILENFHIKTANYLSQNYLLSLFEEEKITLSEMAYKSQLGFNTNEVTIIPKNVKKSGFFEKFFQLFS